MVDYSLLDPFADYPSSAIQQSYIRDLSERERARMDEYIKAREYYDGVQESQITDRVNKFLNLPSGADFTVNYCHMVVNAKADRLKVTGFDTDDTQKALVWDWWRKNRMDRIQGIVHRASIRDGDAFVLVEWDEKADMPRFNYEPAYAGNGVMVYYSDERRQEIEFASKSWQITHGADVGKMRRINLYYPDRIEKYISHSDIEKSNWKAYTEGVDAIAPGRLGEAGINWWTDNRTETGNPLGIPIVHFKHNDSGDDYGTSQLSRVMPIQDAVNKTMIDLLAACDANGFPLFAGFGKMDWSTLNVGPGAIASVNAPPSEADLKILPGFNPQGLLSVYNALVMEIARISGTPMSYFQSSGQVAAEGTMKQQEVALISQAKKSQTDFGNSWEDCIIIARRLHNAFGKGESMDEDELIDTVWEQAETRNEKEQAETIAIKVSSLGVSEEQAQIEMGYDETQIADFARDKLRKQALNFRRVTPTLPGQPSQSNAQEAAQNMTQTENANTPTAGAA